jgi:NitT/TauT family transport system permease protein
MDQHRSQRREYWLVIAIQTAIVLGSLAFWSYASGHWIKPLWISNPWDVLSVIVLWFASGSIWIHLGTTLTETVIGFTLGSGFGFVFGLVLYYWRWLRTILEPIIAGLFAVPKVALAPLFILLFGIEIGSKIALVTVTVFFVVLTSTLAGAEETDTDLKDALRVMGASELDVLRKVVILSAALWVFSGLRIAVRYALTSAIYGEILASNLGVGSLLTYYQGRLDSAGIFAALITLMLLGFVLMTLVGQLERRAMKSRLVVDQSS